MSMINYRNNPKYKLNNRYILIKKNKYGKNKFSHFGLKKKKITHILERFLFKEFLLI